MRLEHLLSGAARTRSGLVNAVTAVITDSGDILTILAILYMSFAHSNKKETKKKDAEGSFLPVPFSCTPSCLYSIIEKVEAERELCRQSYSSVG